MANCSIVGGCGVKNQSIASGDYLGRCWGHPDSGKPWSRGALCAVWCSTLTSVNARHLVVLTLRQSKVEEPLKDHLLTLLEAVPSP